MSVETLSSWMWMWAVSLWELDKMVVLYSGLCTEWSLLATWLLYQMVKPHCSSSNAESPSVSTHDCIYFAFPEGVFLSAGHTFLSCPPALCHCHHFIAFSLLTHGFDPAWCLAALVSDAGDIIRHNESTATSGSTVHCVLDSKQPCSSGGRRWHGTLPL